MNEIIKAMKVRRSIRKFKPDMPKREDIEQIIEAGLYAANGRGAQSAIPLKIRVRDDDGEYQAYMIQGFREEERRGGITTKDGVYVNSHVTVYECQITTFGHKRRIRLYYNEESGIWSMCG